MSKPLPPIWFALVLALAMNLLNLFEPLTVDDVCHSLYAVQVAKAPLQPFEFEIDWHQKPVAAWDVMVAPVTSYYWAPAMALFGDNPVAWKAWFLPLQWLFCYSVLVLLRRVVRRHAGALTVAVGLGATVLPGLNMMLEVPMLAWAFASLAVLLRAFDRRSLAVAAAAGVLLGLALQTKYSAMGFFGPWLLFGLVRGTWRELVVGVATALALAGGIEWLVSCSHGGGSYFMRQLELTQLRDWKHLLRGMVLHVGVLGMPTALLAAWAMRLPSWIQWSAQLIYLAGYVVIALVPNRDALAVRDLAPDSIANGGMAVLTWSLLGLLFWRITWSLPKRLRARPIGRVVRMRCLLLGWFLMEIGASLLVSPFPAARRTLLIVFAFSLAAAWLAVRRRGGGRAVRWFAVGSAVLGVCYQGVDCLDSAAVASAAKRAAEYVRGLLPDARMHFTGGWGFEYYAPRQGMTPMCRGRTQVQRGDFIVVGSTDGAEQPWFDWHAPVWLQRVDQNPHEISIGDAVPFSLLLNYYSGRRPLEGQSGARFVVWVYRVLESFHASELTPVVNPWRDH